MATMGGDASSSLGLIRIVEFSNLDCVFIEIIEQAGIDAHFAKVFAQRLPVSSAATGRAVMDANHPIAPDIGYCLA